LSKGADLFDVELAVRADDWAEGPLDAPVTVIEYGDYDCSDTRRAEPMVQELRGALGDGVRFVYRHFPLLEKHPRAFEAAAATEAAGAQGAFWAMHDALLAYPQAPTRPDLIRLATDLGLDADLFAADLEEHRHASAVEEDLASAARLGVGSSPTFFVNDVSYDDQHDPAVIRRAIDEALAAAR